VERARLDEKEYQYLYADGESFTFMDNETYDQVTMTAEMIGEEAVPFLQENMNVMVESYEGEPIGVTLPQQVVMEIVEADAVVKGQTASSSFKPAVLENGVRIMVPPHIETGTRVVVNTEDRSYVERAKD
uniref:elongation factor P n=1 Tax=Sphingobium sp. TaxID=1912891 RepID=UPI0035C67229